MKKEVLFAIVAGALLGVVIAFGVYRANIALVPSKGDDQKATPAPKEVAGLSIIKPETLRVLTESATVVSGITSPNSNVAIVTDDNEYIVASDNKGQFEDEIELSGGLNEIKVFSFDTSGTQKEGSVLVVFSTEFAKYLTDETTKTGTSSAETQSASDSVRQKVAEKIEKIEKSPTAYIGVVTDITDTNIQIKDSLGEIEQIAIEKDTTDFIKTIGATKKVEFKDLAIGDYIIAMGLKNGNKVLDGKRILVTTPFKSSARTVKLGTTTKDKTNVVTLKDKDNTFTLKFGTNWVGPEISELTETDKYMVIGELKDFNLTVSMIKKI